MDLLRQIRRRRPADGLAEIAARQTLHRRRRGLYRLLDGAARAQPGLRERLIIEILVHLSSDIFRRRRFIRMGLLPARFRPRPVRVGRSRHLFVRRLRRRDFPLRAHDVAHLIPDFPNQLRFPQPGLLFLPVKYRT